MASSMSTSFTFAPPELDCEGKDPWHANTHMIVPYEKTQMLIPEEAAILGVQAFLKMAELPYSIKEVHNAADISPNGKVPVLKCGAYVVAEMEAIVQLAKGKGVSLTDYLNAADKADLRAYISLVHNVLGNALMYFAWVDDDTYNRITKERVGSPYNFPLRVLLPWSLRRKIVSQLNALGWGRRTPDEVYREVEQCLQALSERLDKGEYFFKGPTELDALTYGYLFTMMTTSSPNSNQLRNLVKQFPNLDRFCDRIEREYFLE